VVQRKLQLGQQQVPIMTHLYLWPATNECPEGASVQQDDCYEAALFLIEKSDCFQPQASKRSSLFVLDLSSSPCGCFLYEYPSNNQYYVLFDTSTTECFANYRSHPICTVPLPSRLVLRTT